jgi:hypothetical protein
MSRNRPAPARPPRALAPAVALLLAACTPPAGAPDGAGDGRTTRVEGELHGAFLDLPCASEEMEMQYCVPREQGIRSVSLQFGGDPARTYSVALRVWGVVEAVRYEGGTRAADHFYIDGHSVTPKTAEYTLEVAGTRYHLNHFDNNAGDHYTFAVEYTAPTIPIPGASTLVLSVRDPDNYVNTNHMETAVAAPPPALRQKLEPMQDLRPRWQYIYMEVASVKER